MATSQKTYLLAYFHVTFALLSILISHAAPLAFNYQDFSNTGDTLNFAGEVSPENGVLQLTRYHMKDSLGRVKYYRQLHLWDRNSGKVKDFTTRFSFSTNTPNNSSYGDGITFFLAKPDFPLPDPRDGSGIGLVSRDQWHTPNYTNEHPFVAVEFDTVSNDWDPPYAHVGIDISSMQSARTTEWFRSWDERGYDAVITYSSSSNNIVVTFTGYNITKIEQNLSYEVNLTEVLPEWVEFGFTSATGYAPGADFSYEYHTIRSWSFNSSLDFEAHKDDNDQSKTGLVTGLSIGAVALIGVLGLAFLVG